MALSAWGQVPGLQKKVAVSDSLNTLFPREKLFIHHDKPYYRLRDTIWLKGYILNGPENTPNDSSRFVYIEVIDAQHQVIRRIMTPAIMGIFAADIPLVEKEYRQGQYALRAYTRFQRNWGDSLFFTSRFTIIDPASAMRRTHIRELTLAENRLRLHVNFTQENRRPLSNRPVTVRLRSGRRQLFRMSWTTDDKGILVADTVLARPDRSQLQLEIADGDTILALLPVKHSLRQLDLQFLPEGGQFIAGKRQRLGFKAINSLGKGEDVAGDIHDSQGRSVASFASVHKGMGYVWMTPQAGESYHAVCNGARYLLPDVSSSGILLQVDSPPGADSLTLRIDASPDQYGRLVYFTSTTAGITTALGRVRMQERPFEMRMDRSMLTPGIHVFTLFDDALRPVNGRAVFIEYNTPLKIDISAHKDAYLRKDSVSLQLKVQNSGGQDISGTFSMAVLDTLQVNMNADAENLISYMLLSADLRGEIESPYYYFKQPDPDATEALVLTQGWVRYDAQPPHTFPYEKEFELSGRVSNILGKQVSESRVTLFGKAGWNQAFVRQAETGKDGRFVFKDFDYYDTDSISLVMKALNKRGKAFNVGINMKEPDYPGTEQIGELYTSTSLLADTLSQDYIARQEMIKAALRKEGIVLEEVVVTARTRIPGSQNLNKNGGADQVISESDLNKNPKATLLDILREQVPGFRVGSPPRSQTLYYMIQTNIVRLIIDGTNVNFFFNPVGNQNNENIVFLDDFLKYILAEDIKGIEIMNTPQYNSTYRSEYLTLQEQLSSGPVNTDFSFLEITTRSGSGPFLKKTPGTYLLRPLYPKVSRQFYSPRYKSPEETTIAPDLRSTLYWNPFVTTDTNGVAQVSFYTSENRTGYLVIVQGMDLQGNLGVQWYYIRQEPTKPD